MEIPLNRDDPTPLYRQIQAHITQLIHQGLLPADTRLPATRRLADDLGVNRITVSNAYAELEANGLVYAHTGRGTFVNALPTPPPANTPKQTSQTDWPLWQQALSAKPIPTHYGRWPNLMARAQEPGVISFAGGAPDLETFPVDDFRKAMQIVFQRDGQKALDYGQVQGYPPLRRAIALFLGEQGIPISADQVFVASGSQQALNLLAQTLLKPGDAVIVENPTYAHAVQLFSWLGARILGVPLDSQGLRVDLLEHLIQHHHPRLIYTVPTFHNPTSITLSSERRRQLLALAERYSLPIIEDDYLSGLRYDGPQPASLKALDQTGNVIHVSTFSKMLMPGPRIGFVLARGPLLEQLIALKRQTDLGTSALIQRALQVYVDQGHWRTHTRRVVRFYRARRDAMIAALKHYFPPEAEWAVPQGGFFVWLRLPDRVSITDLYLAALERLVAFAPGHLFFAGEPSYPALRLSFSQQPPERIFEGIERLGEALCEVLDQTPLAAKPVKRVDMAV